MVIQNGTDILENSLVISYKTNYNLTIQSIKKVELQRTDGFELWCWRRLLRVPWRARDIFPMPAPSWKITLESGNVFARLAKGSQDERYFVILNFINYINMLKENASFYCHLEKKSRSFI